MTLVLKALCDFSVQTIAQAFLTIEFTINKRLFHTRRALRSAPEFAARKDRAYRHRRVYIYSDLS